MSFVPWLRGFLEGIGENDLTPEQGQRIISEIQRSLGLDQVPAPLVTEARREPVVLTKGKKGKPVTREQVLEAAKGVAPLVPSDLPGVERLG